MPRAVSRTTPNRALILFVVAAILVAASTTLLGNRAEAAITTPFSTRFQANVNGSILLRGNTNLVCSTAATGCSNALNGVGSGGETLNNNGYVMANADADGDAATFNDSNATVTIPAGGTVLFAGLYWSADPTAGTGGSAAPTAADKGKVLFRTPTSSNWQNVTASTVFTDPSIAAYQGFANVTQLVAGAGSGTYAVANIQAGLGNDRYAGWALAIAYQKASEPMHSLRIYDGFGVVSNTSTQVTINAGGFQTPQTGPVGASIGTVVYEGDLGKTGDALQLDGAPMSDSANPADNFFNSTVSAGGTLINAGRSPGNKNLMGVDIDQFDASGKLGVNVQSANLTLTTGGETYYPGVVTFTTDLNAPKLVASMTSTDNDGGDLLPGDEIVYRVAVENQGTDTARNAVLTNAIPTHTTYVPGSMKIETAGVTDASGDDAGQFSGGTATFGIGSGATGVTGGSMAYQATTYVTFRVKVDLDTPPGYQIVNLANLAYDPSYTLMTTTGVSGADTVTVRQPQADLAATLAASPSTVQRSAAPAAVAYTATVKNNGTDLEPAAVATLTLPAGVTAGTLPAGCSASGQVVTCSAGPLVTGSSATVTIPATATTAAAASAVATLAVSGAGLDGVAGNNTDTATLRVNTAPVAADDTDTTASATPVDVAVKGNDADVDDATSGLTVSVISAPAHGTAVAQADGTIRYTPAAAWAGADTFRYELADGIGGTATANVTVTTANARPTAADDDVATAAVTPVDITVLANDTDANNDALHVDSITQPPASAGTATLTGNVVRFTPAAGFSGRATFTYTVEDARGGQTVGQIHVDVDNTRPTAADDHATVAYHGTVTIDVLGNDTDANPSDTLSVTGVGTPDHGTATINAGNIDYAAPTGFSGTATFTYTVSDGHPGGTATATVTVTVANALPTAPNLTVSTPTATALRIDAAGAAGDPNPGDNPTVSGTTNPAHGTLALNADGSLRYLPDAGYRGPDSFTYTVSDGHPGGTATGTVTVTVTNGVPTAAPESVTVPANTSATIDVLANDGDPNNDPLTVTVDVAPLHGTATVGSDGKVTYVPAAGYRGTDTFHYTIDDGHGGTDGATVQTTMVNTAPAALADAVVTDTDTAVTIPVPANDTDPNGDAVTVTAVSGAGHGTSVLNSDGTVRYTPAAGFFGTDTFTYSITDPDGLTDTAIVTVTVLDAAPIAVDDSYVVHPGETKTLTLLANDRDPNTGQALRVSLLGTASKGRAVLAADGTVTYRPDAMTTGVDTFQYTVTDTAGLTDTATVTIVIDAAPIAAPDAASTRTGTAVDVAVLANDTDGESEPLTLISAGTPEHGTVTLAGGKVRYTPAAGWTGTDTFTYVVGDSVGNKSTGTVTVRVGDAAPVAAPDVAGVVTGGSVTIDVLANDNDPNPGQTLRVSAVTAPAHGTAVLVGGKIKYTPEAGWAGTDTFGYTVVDERGNTASSTVKVVVTDGGAATLPDTKKTTYQRPVTIPVLTNDLNPDQSLKLTKVSTPDHGTAVIAGNQIVYTPPAGFSGVAKFTYTATDDSGKETTTDVTVTVGAPPVVPGRTATAKAGTPVTIKLPTVDRNGKPITVTKVGTPKHGTAKLNADGTVTYVPEDGWTGTDSIPFEAVDADGNAAAASITVTVSGAATVANRAPVATKDAITVQAGRSIVIKPLANDKDADGDKLKVTKIGKPRHGTAVLNADGTVTYAPSDDYSGGTDSFAYWINDGHGHTTKATILVQVDAGTAGGSGSGDNLAKTGLDIVSVASAGLLAIAIGGVLYLGALRGGIAFPALAGLERPGPGRHRPGRHRN